MAEVQRLLTELGYNPGPVDGIYGTATETAIRAYLSDHGLPQTGTSSIVLIEHMQNTRNAMLQKSAPQVSTGPINTGPISAQHVSATPQIRAIQPVQTEGRLITGYPLIYGKYNKIETQLGGRETIKSHLDLALYIDLAVLKQWPEILDNDYIAASYANRFLIDSMLTRYFTGCQYGSCSQNKPYDGWKGGNEFERESSYRAFVETYRPVLINMASDLPVKLLQVYEIALQPYDKTLEVFPIKFVRPQPSVFATVHSAVWKFGSEIKYTLPKNVPVPIGQAPAFISNISADSRTAYVSVEASLGEPLWDYELDRPTLSVQLESAALYADPDLQTKLHDFGETVNQSPVATTADSSIKANVPDTAHSIPVEVTIPTGLLLYKYVPDSFNDDVLLQMTKQQIARDQYEYENPEYSSDHFFVFSKNQVEGRVPEFAVKELLPIYKEHLRMLADQIPDKIKIVRPIGLEWLEYSGGSLKMKSQPYLSLESTIPDHDRKNLPDETTGWEVLSTPQNFLAEISNFELSEFVRYFSARGRQVLLALDRIPLVPPVRINSKDAEQMWKRPECSIRERDYLRDGMNKEDAVQAANECLSRKQLYGSSPVVSTHFELEIKGVIVTERAWIIQAQLIGAQVYGPYKNQLVALSASEFTSAEQKLAEETQNQKQTIDQERSQIAELAEMDILGVRVGMSVNEAESILRASQNIETVYRFTAAAVPANVREAQGWQFEPYNSGLLFVANEGKDVITLFFQDEDRVLGVSRKMRADGLKKETLASALNDKYGKPTHSDNHSWTWGHTGKASSCSGSGNIDAQSNMELIEGNAVKNVTYKAVGIAVRREYAKAETLAECSTMLQVGANLVSTSQPSVEFRLFNHRAVAEMLKEIENQQKASAERASTDLKL